jgi:hypothetical protein
MTAPRGRRTIGWGALLLCASAVIAGGCVEDGGDGVSAQQGGSGGAAEAGADQGAPAGASVQQGGSNAMANGGATARAGGGAGGDVSTSQAGAGGDMSSSGAGPEGGKAGQGGGGGASSSDACVENKLLGTYRLQAHSNQTTCFEEDLHCGAPSSAQDTVSYFSLFASRDSPDNVQGEFRAPGVTLNGSVYDYEIWDVPFFFYYPQPGEHPDIWAEQYASLGMWDPSYDGAWVRAITDVCFGDPEFGYKTGFVHIDIELATGRVLNFARRCDDHFITLWNEYDTTGTGELACELDACNELENTASAAEIVEVDAEEVMQRGEISSGTYHLTSIRYWLPGTAPGACTYQLPASVSETLVVAAASPTTGTFSSISHRPPAAPVRSTHSYNAHDFNGRNLETKWECGQEALSLQWGGLYEAYTATESELRLQSQVYECEGYATYVYEKQ